MVSPPGERVGIPIARRLIFRAADRYRSSSVGDRSPTVTLSKPWLDSSLGSSERDIDVERQQVADGVLIFGPVEPAEGVGTAGIRASRRPRDQAKFRARQQRCVGPLIGPRQSGGRHGSRAQLADDLLPRLRCCRTLWMSSESSAKPAVFTLVLWHPTQYFFTIA